MTNPLEDIFGIKPWISTVEDALTTAPEAGSSPGDDLAPAQLSGLSADEKIEQLRYKEEYRRTLNDQIDILRSEILADLAFDMDKQEKCYLKGHHQTCEVLPGKHVFDNLKLRQLALNYPEFANQKNASGKAQLIKPTQFSCDKRVFDQVMKTTGDEEFEHLKQALQDAYRGRSKPTIKPLDNE